MACAPRIQYRVRYGALAADAGEAIAPVSGIDASDAAAMGAGAGVAAGEGGGESAGADLLQPTRANVATNAAENMIFISVSSFL
jgi:hypothetical protein